ncbi:MAG TPA: chemotaxis protein CheW [Thermoanaerobaculia bacterium]|jgi:chemotaxis signal transduction protein|nr:chemotaxis protein CheW [Thermoanaerobaculia bacterium]
MVDLVKIRKKAKEKKSVAPAIPPESAAEIGGATPATDKLQRFLETAGKRRVTETASAEPAAPQLEALTFAIAGELYAIDIENVVEIVTVRPITRIPNADPSIVGIFSLRGAIVTLIDVRRRLGHRDAEGGGLDERVVVVQHGGEMLGFIVDRVLRVVKVDADSLEPHPIAHASEQDESVRGVFRHGEALTMLIALDRVLNGTVV